MRFSCSVEKRPRCDYFQYVDTLYNMNRKVDRITADEIKKWECPFVFQLLDGVFLLNGEKRVQQQQTVETKRSKIATALIVTEMVKNFGRKHRWSSSSIPKETSRCERL
eukprot:scaffold13335_cov174-Alexandrium_tamarense.AAC.1